MMKKKKKKKRRDRKQAAELLKRFEIASTAKKRLATSRVDNARENVRATNVTHDSSAARDRPGRTNTAEQLELLRSAKSGDQAATNAIVRRNLILVHRIARYRQYEKIEFDDLVQEGSIGLLMAITKFEPNSEFTFAAQATPWIMAMMSRFAGNNRCSIRQPLYKQQQIRNIRKSINSLRVKLRREPTAQQIAIHMQLDERHVKGLIEAMNTEQDILSTDGGISNDEDDDSRKLIDQIADESRRTESAAEASEHRKITKSLLKTLTARERKVLQLSFGLLKDRTEHTHEQIAHQLRITRQSSTRIEERALKKLRRECARRGYELRDYIDE